jgi:ATP-dependent exoDNAse (exonuclease V) beta subunit
MRVFATFGETLDQAIAYAEHLFKQQGSIRLLTGHKAKGLEWDIVYHLDPWLIKDNDDQELNLRYVIGTRAKQESYEIDGKRINW